jgi:hypothetical protein
MRTIRLTTLVLGCALASVSSVGAQATQSVDIDDLRTPSSPAFVLLGVTPTAVERPENAKALVFNLLSTASQGGGLPQNYALQVAPYWLKSHPDLQFEDYQNPSFLTGVVRSLSLSVATSPLEDESGEEAITIGTRLGLGARTNLVGGQRNPVLDRKLDELRKLQEEALDDPGDPDLRARLIQAALDIQHVPRLGLFVSAAGGVTWSIPQDDVARRELERWGVWVTPAYRFELCQTANVTCRNVLDVIAVVRALREHDDDTQWDFGGRLLWEPTEQFNLSAEFIRRSGPEGEDRSSDRTVGVVEYRIREDLLLFGSFGKDFEKVDSRRTLVSLMGLSFGFGRKASVKR